MRHGHYDRGYRNGSSRRDDRDPRMIGDPAYYARAPLLRKLTMALGLVLWSLLAWIGYVVVDPVLGWVAASTGVLLDTGKSLATAAGAGNEVGAVVDSLNVSGFLGQAIALLRVVLKPAIVGIWAIGTLALIAAPVILPKLGRLREHR